jgi:hypothetical protein
MGVDYFGDLYRGFNCLQIFKLVSINPMSEMWSKAQALSDKKYRKMVERFQLRSSAF